MDWHHSFSPRDYLYLYQQNHHQGNFFDFGFGNETGYYDVIQRSPPPPGDNDDSLSAGTPRASSSSDEVKREYSTKVFTDRALEVRHETSYDMSACLLFSFAVRSCTSPTKKKRVFEGFSVSVEPYIFYWCYGSRVPLNSFTPIERIKLLGWS